MASFYFGSCAAFILLTADFACRAELFTVSMLCFESTKKLILEFYAPAQHEWFLAEE